MWKLKQELARSLGSSELDPESQVGRAVRMLRADLVDDLGGPDHISTAESILVDVAVRTHLILGAIDRWLLTQESLLVGNKVKKLQPVARERTALVDSLGRTLRTLGTKRKEGPALDLNTYLPARARTEVGNQARHPMRPGPRRPGRPAVTG
jgi:hypothetical protein